MAESNGDNEVKNPGRRGLLKGAAIGVGLGIAGGAIYTLGERAGTNTVVSPVEPTPEIQRTAEQREKQSALRELSKFMLENTNSVVVADFLSRASVDEINNAFTLGKEHTDYGSILIAWQLRLPHGTLNHDEHVPTISYITDILNPQYQGSHEEVRVYLDKEGEVKKGLKTDDPNLYLKKDPTTGYDPLSEEDMKLTLARFAKNNMFYVDEGWDVHYRNQNTGKVTEYTKSEMDDQGVLTEGVILETGYASLTISIQPPKPIVPFPVQTPEPTKGSPIF